MIKLKKIYEESVLKFTEKMNSDEKECFLSEVITYSNVQSSLYQHRQKFIPKVPKEFADFDPAHDFIKKIDTEQLYIRQKMKKRFLHPSSYD